MGATAISLVNMKGGVGKTTLAFNLSSYCAWKENKKVLCVDLDPQANLSQYFLGVEKYLELMKSDAGTVVEIFEQFSAPRGRRGSPVPVKPSSVIHTIQEWSGGSLIHLIPSRLELAWTLKNPTDKAHLLPQFLAKLHDKYDLIFIDCAPTESILTQAAYRSCRYLIVPVKPEFLATIGLPLLARSLEEFRLAHEDQSIEMAGIVFNDADPHLMKKEQNEARKDVRNLAKDYGWPVFENEARHSDSYPSGSRTQTPLFRTKHARWYVVREFNAVAKEFLEKVEVK